MGVIYGLINILVAVWFYSSAVSVKKQAVLWAVIGGLSFMAFKFLGYSLISTLQESLDDARKTIDKLVEKNENLTRISIAVCSGMELLIAQLVKEDIEPIWKASPKISEMLTENKEEHALLSKK